MKDSDRESFESWFKSLNENGRTTYFLGQESTVGWLAWQAAKAQAIPDGFVVVSTKDLNIIYDQINDWNTDWSIVFGLFNRILGVQEK